MIVPFGSREIFVYKTTQGTSMGLQEMARLSWIIESRAEHSCHQSL